MSAFPEQNQNSPPLGVRVRVRDSVRVRVRDSVRVRVRDSVRVRVATGKSATATCTPPGGW